MSEIKLTIQLDKKLQALAEDLIKGLNIVTGKTLCTDIDMASAVPAAPPLAPQQPVQAQQPTAPAQPQAPVVPVAPPAQMAAPVATLTQPAPQFTQAPQQYQQPTMQVQAPVYAAPSQQMPGGLPTTAPAYTQDQIAQAAALLADRSPQDRYNVQSLMSGKYGVQMITAILPEHYPAFAADLRAMGAQI